MGRIIDGTFSSMSPDHKLQVLEYNARQLSNLSRDTQGVELLHEASRLIMSKNLTSEDMRAVESLLGSSILSYQENLVGNLTNYDLYILALSVLLVISSVGIQPGSVPNLSLPLIFLILSFHFLTCSVVESELCSLSPAAGFIIFLSILILPSIRHVYNSSKNIIFNGEFVPLCFLLPHSFSFLSSSFIEEEHQTLYFLSATLLLYSSINTDINDKERGRRGQVLSAGLALGLHRLLRGFNQTGDKWRHLPDISDNLNLQPNLRFNLFVLSAVSTLIFLNLSYSGLFLNFIIIICIILQKYYVSVELAQIVYLALLIKIVVQRRQSTLFYETVILLCCLLLEETNVICLFVLLCYLNVVKPVLMHVQPATALVMAIFIIKSSFFYFGNSNSLSTINVGAGYMGLTAYSPGLVIVQLAVHTYAGPCVSLAYLLQHLEKDALKDAYFFSTWSDIVVFAILCILLRFHIFVWTVFAPKLLYFGMELIIFNAFFALSGMFSIFMR